MPDEYYHLARRLGALDRQSLANELRAFHQQTIEAAVEYATEIVREGREQGQSLEEIEAAVRSVELKGEQIADDRLYLRKAEAALYVLRERRALIVAKTDIRRAFDAGHGVQLVANNQTMLEVSPRRGKFLGK
jgi:hypothetical protein